jgi:hypothetical protein
LPKDLRPETSLSENLVGDLKTPHPTGAAGREVPENHAIHGLFAPVGSSGGSASVSGDRGGIALIINPPMTLMAYSSHSGEFSFDAHFAVHRGTADDDEDKRVSSSGPSHLPAPRSAIDPRRRRMPFGVGVPLSDEIYDSPAFQPFLRSDFLVPIVLSHEAEACATIFWHGRRASQYLDVRSAIVTDKDTAGFAAGFRRGRKANHFLHDGIGERHEPAFRQKDHDPSLPQAGQ